MSSKIKDVEIGDWISFMSGGVIQYGEVVYKTPCTYTDGWVYHCAANCMISEDSILEVRKSAKCKM